MRKVLTAAVLATVVAGSGCSSPPEGAGITVFAAASLTAVFTELGTEFEKDHPGTTVTFNFAGSSALVTQLTQGARAEVFASADTANMTKAVSAGLVSGEPVDFATNQLIIVTPPGNPSRIGSFADLARPGTQVVVCAPQVPCGAATQRLEQITGVSLTPVSEESSVTDVLGKVTSGQADAGLVYTTDARSAGAGVDAIAIPDSARAVNTYPIAVLTTAENAGAARQFVDLVTGPRGRETLTAAGFAAP
ncbi:molybdate ABC transporter substrate-binding protein [Mycobacterium sp. PSTR-4-N]|uniref:molybdate ABC transporter substrate-binding protein n=1 Tax=Mycobacterium sp. PSTR-4-N TaxID=2917745 RepID=UPI001F14B73B|nr:molybdate ABC transporter substrate-binding protein [Mycobacterium sp. PSTR-4-N]MCG7597815.1 molybdate ABC transporter substrate-binding protein [Mycobacterium sp. PSTR-4-N]